MGRFRGVCGAVAGRCEMFDKVDVNAECGALFPFRP